MSYVTTLCLLVLFADGAVSSVCRWADWGKFLTGFSAVGMIAIPASLRHAEVIPSISVSSHASVFVLLKDVLAGHPVGHEPESPGR